MRAILERAEERASVFIVRVMWAGGRESVEAAEAAEREDRGGAGDGEGSGEPSAFWGGAGREIAEEAGGDEGEEEGGREGGEGDAGGGGDEAMAKLCGSSSVKVG